MSAASTRPACSSPNASRRCRRLFSRKKRANRKSNRIGGIMINIRVILGVGLLAALTMPCSAASKQLTVKAVNKLTVARPSQTIELSSKQLASLGAKELATIHVKDAAGKELLCQAV